MKKKFLTLLVTCAFIAFPLTLVGCGASEPENATEDPNAYMDGTDADLTNADPEEDIPETPERVQAIESVSQTEGPFTVKVDMTVTTTTGDYHGYVGTIAYNGDEDTTMMVAIESDTQAPEKTDLIEMRPEGELTWYATWNDDSKPENGTIVIRITDGTDTTYTYELPIA